MSSKDSSKKKALRFGSYSENFALFFLLLKGYYPLERRFSSREGEIDLIVIKGKTLIFVEVKARQNLSDAFEAISEEKKKRLLSVTHYWLSKNIWSSDYTLRMDAVFIAPWHIPQHIRNIFPL